jgi:hypothetical protein
MILRAIHKVDGENSFNIFRLEKASNNVHILVSGAVIDQIIHERDMSTTSQGTRHASVSSRNPGITPHLNVSAIAHTPDQAILEQGNPFQYTAPSVRDSRRGHCIENGAIREVLCTENPCTEGLRFLE